MNKNHTTTAWLLFIALCVIWGSSFILMKLAMYGPAGQTLLSAWQVGALRMFFAGIVLLPFAIGALKRSGSLGVTRYVIGSGFLGSFFPAFLFCIAETRIESALAGTLNALTPLFTLLIATLVYRTAIPSSRWIGIGMGLTDCIMLFLVKGNADTGNAWFSGFVVIATICYAINVNMVKQKLQGLPSLDIASIALSALIIPSLAVLAATGYFQLPITDNLPLLRATGATALLGAVGTGVASVLFYLLVTRAGIIFASLVTYGIPFIALGWGFWYGEKITPMQIVSLLIILAGVYLANINLAAFAPSWLRRTKSDDNP